MATMAQGSLIAQGFFFFFFMPCHSHVIRISYISYLLALQLSNFFLREYPGVVAHMINKPGSINMLTGRSLRE